MKTITLTGPRKLECLDTPRPTLRKPTDVLLKVERVGVCGSDVHYFETGRIGSQVVQYPFVVGHECSATVVETARPQAELKPGSTVAVDPAMACLSCDQCLAGRENTCRHLRFLGCPGQAPGCLSEHIVMPEHSLYPVTDRLSLDQAALCEPFSIGVYAAMLGSGARTAGVTDHLLRSTTGCGLEVALLGAGPIGLSVQAAVKAMGAGAIFVTDLLPNRLEAARRQGAVWAGSPEQEDIVRSILARQPQGMDIVYECAGQQATLDQAIELLKPGGLLLIVGIPREDRVSFPIETLRRKEITVINVRRQNRCMQPAIDLIAHRSVNIDFLVTHRFAAEQAQAAFDLVAGYRDGVLKAIIEF